jgi:tRNA(Ile)-lysidine synthase
MFTPTPELLPNELQPLLHEAAACDGRIVLGYSGGLDSSVLLAALVHGGYADKLLAVHVHHGLSEQADDWLRHCQSVCAEYGVAFVAERVALDGADNLEARARDVRRHALLRHVEADDQLWLAHHHDDQAETLLLRLMRGAGSRGLAGMRAHSRWQGRQLCRPLLGLSRQALTKMATDWALDWVEDASNTDVRFDRNFLRKVVLPSLVGRWPATVSRLGAAADRLSEDAALLDELAAADFDDCDGMGNSLDCQRLAALSAARQRNLLRGWLSRRGVLTPSAKVLQRVLTEVLTAAEDREPRVEWAHGVFARFRERLYLLSRQVFALPPGPCLWQPADSAEVKFGLWCLGLGAAVDQRESALCLPQNGPLTVCVAQGGERILWRGMHRQVSELWRQQGIPPWQRKQMPLIYREGQLVAVAGVGVADDSHPQPGDAVWMLSICAQIADFAL